MIGCQITHFDVIHYMHPRGFFTNLVLRCFFFQISLLDLCTMCKSENYQNYEKTGFELFTCDSNHCFFPQGCITTFKPTIPCLLLDGVKYTCK